MKEDFTEFLRHIKEKNDIVDVIGSYLKLERRGYSYWACCPFHHEKTPSFSVNAGDKYYHCFGCQVSGDVITFIKEYENVDFMQAVKILADRAGMEIPAFDDRSAQELALKKQKKDRLHALMKDAARFYLNNLYAGKAEPHLEYLAKRGIEPSTMKKFGLGASLDYASLPAYLRANGYTLEECVESGACAEAEDGRTIDAMGGRLIIPIIDSLGEVVAFGGRLLKKSDRAAKYKNTRDTEIFEKSKNLFNINLIKKEKRAGGIPHIILVEGYMDVISLYQAGFHCVGASMGTSLTKDQARLIKRYTENVLISYDGDSAGQNANLRGLDILKREGLKVRVVPLPDGLDPDDVVQKQGEEGYKSCLEKAMPLIDFRILCIQRKYDMQKTEERREFVKEALPIVKEAESATEREELLKRISRISGTSLTALSSDLENAKPRKEAEPQRETPRIESDRQFKAADFVLCACLFSKPYAKSTDLTQFSFEGDRERIARFITESRKKGSFRASGIFDVLGSDSEVLSGILNLDCGDNLDGADAERYFGDCMKALKREELNGRLTVLKERSRHTESTEELIQITTEINELAKELKKL